MLEFWEMVWGVWPRLVVLVHFHEYKYKILHYPQCVTPKICEYKYAMYKYKSIITSMSIGNWSKPWVWGHTHYKSGLTPPRSGSDVVQHFFFLVGADGGYISGFITFTNHYEQHICYWKTSFLLIELLVGQLCNLHLIKESLQYVTFWRWIFNGWTLATVLPTLNDHYSTCVQQILSWIYCVPLVPAALINIQHTA